MRLHKRFVHQPIAALYLMQTILIVSATFDINIHQLMMVSDHLTEDGCRRLSEALHMTHYQTEHPLTGKTESDVPCLDLLLNWDRNEGRGKTFLDLALRLKQIGRWDLANRLSRSVYHEQSEAVRKYYLEMPFRNLINRNSTLLEENRAMQQDLYVSAMRARSQSCEWTAFHTYSTVVFVIFGAVIFSVVVGGVASKSAFVRRQYVDIRESFYRDFIGRDVPAENRYTIV